MKVILSIDPIKYPLTGIGRYTFELAQGFINSNEIESLKFLKGYKTYNDLSPIKSNELKIKSLNFSNYLKSSKIAPILYQAINPLILKNTLSNYKNYIFHNPNYYSAPFDGISVVTFHDLSMYLWPQTHPISRVRYMQKEIEKTLKRTNVIITDTEFIRHELANYFGFPLDKITTVNLASGDEFKQRNKEELSQFLRDIGLEFQGYSLFIGTIEPRKNLNALLDAYSKLSLTTRKKWPLIIAGFSGWSSDDLHLRMLKAQQEGWLRYLGYLPNKNLPLLMAGARLFVYPSLYEGFGLPVIEAMASGVPVVCSNASCLPEVAGDAALFHKAEDIDELNNLLIIGLEDDFERKKIIDLGLKQAGKYSWARCVEETLDVYKFAQAL